MVYCLNGSHESESNRVISCFGTDLMNAFSSCQTSMLVSFLLIGQMFGFGQLYVIQSSLTHSVRVH